MGIVFRTKLKVLGKLILAFIGCLFFQITVQNWIYADEDLVVLLSVLRPIVSILIGRKVFEWCEYELPNGIARICFKMTFGYLMFVMPVLWVVELIILISCAGL